MSIYDMFVCMLCSLRTLLPCVLFMTKTSIVLSAIWDYDHVCDVVVYSTQVYSTMFRYSKLLSQVAGVLC